MGALKNAGLIIPVLLLLVALEYYLSKRKGKEVYRLSDSIVNMCCGMLERLFDVFFVVMLYFLFDFFFQTVAPWQITLAGHSLPVQILIWIGALLVADFLAYWHHRLSHEINFLWAAHIVHHQSEELNLTTVFRVSAFAVINRTFFWIWMPIMGFSPEITTSALVFIGLYQFVTHTRLVGKLGWLEYVLVTPSHHRVHHARNEKYLDTNYGHVFIIWDRMLGTFIEEEEEPDYGITTGFHSSNPYWAYLHYWASLFRRSREAKNWKDKIRVFVAPPSWNPEGAMPEQPQYEVDPVSGKRKNYDLKAPIRLQLYVLFSVLTTLGAFVFMLINQDDLSAWAMGGLTGIIALSVMAHGGTLECKKWALRLEYLRLLIVSVAAPLLLWNLAFAWLSIPAFLLMNLTFLIWVLRMRDYFHPPQVQTPTKLQPVTENA